ncbi:MAG: AI-2E family transporter [Bryobacteraceae bacterium]|jgi:predicted PurR-regulated permease PerM
MAYFWNRPFFHKRSESGPATSAVDTRSAAVPVALGASRHPLPNSNQWAMVMLFGTIAGLYFAREILIPLALAVILTFVLSPVVALLERARIGRALSVAVTVLVAMAAAGGVSWIIAVQLVEVAEDFPTYRQNIHAKMEALRIPSEGPLGLAANSLKEIGREISSPYAPAPAAGAAAQIRKQRSAPITTAAPLPVQIVPQAAGELDYLRELVQPVVRPLAEAGLVLIFTIFMLIKRFDLRHRLFRLVGLGQINMMTQALDDAARRVSRYLLMQILVNAGFGTLFGIGLYFIGVPNPALWGAVAGILRIVPYLGTMLAAAMPIALSLAAFNSWLPPLLVFLVFVGLELIIGNFVEPWLYGTNTGISSLALLVAAVFWTVLWGPAGLILSTPLTVCVVVLGRYVPQFSFLHILLGDEEVLGAEAQIYQRLLAMDQPEAHAIVDRFLKEKPLVELYDSVFIPALSLVEEDRHKGALDTTREEFVYLSISELINELSEHQPARDSAPAEEAAVESGPAERVNANIICLPANDRADEVTAVMLAQLLEQAGHAALSLPIALAAPAALLALLEKRQDDIICISALPPYAFPPARTMCKLIRERFPNLKLVVGVWGYSGDTEKAKARFERTQPDRLLTSLAQAVEQIQELIRPRAPGPAPDAPKAG